MLVKTVDVIVRESLLDNRLSMHSYVSRLHHALRCIEDLSIDLNLGTNIKDLTVDILTDDRVDIPALHEVIGIYGIVGDKKLPFELDESLTLEKNLESAVSVGYTSVNSTFTDEEHEDPDGTGTFGYQRNAKYTYKVDVLNDQVVLGHKHEMTIVGLLLRTNIVSVTTANAIDVNAVKTILAYVEWMISEANGSPQSKVMRLQDLYYNEKGNLRGRLNPIGIEDLYSSVYGSYSNGRK